MRIISEITVDEERAHNISELTHVYCLFRLEELDVD